MNCHDNGDTGHRALNTEPEDGDERTVKNAEEVVLRAMFAEDDDAVEDYHSGESGALNFLVGQVIQKSQGSADPGSVTELLRSQLAD